MQHVVKAWRMFLIPRKELRMKYAQLQMEKWKKESEEKVRKFLMKCVRRNRKLWEECVLLSSLPVFLCFACWFPTSKALISHLLSSLPPV